MAEYQLIKQYFNYANLRQNYWNLLYGERFLQRICSGIQKTPNATWRWQTVPPPPLPLLCKMKKY